MPSLHERHQQILVVLVNVSAITIIASAAAPLCSDTGCRFRPPHDQPFIPFTPILLPSLQSLVLCTRAQDISPHLHHLSSLRELMFMLWHQSHQRIFRPRR